MIAAATFRRLAAALPGAIEHPHFDKSSFRVKKRIFATLDEIKNVAVVKLTPVDQSAFFAFDTTVIYPVPGGWGKQGWTMIDLQKVKISALRDALRTSYETVAKIKR